MKRNRFVQSILVLLIAAAVHGCTVVGYGVGYMLDHAEESEALRAPKEKLYGMDEGDSIVVVMHDGRRIAGRFVPGIPFGFH